MSEITDELNRLHRELETAQKDVLAKSILVGSWSNQYAEAIAERDAAREELAQVQRIAESRYDCHGGPGTTLPACGACVTCLMRERDTEHDKRIEAEAIVELKDQGIQSLKAQMEAKDKTIRDQEFVRRNLLQLRETDRGHIVALRPALSAYQEVAAALDRGDK